MTYGSSTSQANIMSTMRMKERSVFQTFQSCINCTLLSTSQSGRYKCVHFIVSSSLCDCGVDDPTWFAPASIRLVINYS